MRSSENKSEEVFNSWLAPPQASKKKKVPILPNMMENSQLQSFTHAKDKELTNCENKEVFP